MYARYNHAVDSTHSIHRHLFHMRYSSTASLLHQDVCVKLLTTKQNARARDSQALCPFQDLAPQNLGLTCEDLWRVWSCTARPINDHIFTSSTFSENVYSTASGKAVSFAEIHFALAMRDLFSVKSLQVAHSQRGKQMPKQRSTEGRPCTLPSGKVTHSAGEGTGSCTVLGNNAPPGQKLCMLCVACLTGMFDTKSRAQPAVLLLCQNVLAICCL